VHQEHFTPGATHVDSKKKGSNLSRRDFVISAAAGLALGDVSRVDAAANKLTLLMEQQGAGNPSRVIIDTDPGVDDAFALLLAMRSPELKIEAITAVAGNVPLELTLPNALRMAEIAGRTDIPVAGGASAPLARRLVTAAYAHGENGLGGAVFPEPKITAVTTPAAEVIRQTVRKFPGQITIITLGPQTNIATALTTDPDLARMVRGLVMMGGSLSGGNITPAAEFNVYVDPEASRIVFQSGIPVIMVGLDVTRRTALTEDHFRDLQRGQNPASQAAAKIARNAIDHSRARGFTSGPNMHDSLAVAGFIEPSLLTWRQYYVDVETVGELTAGETLGYRPNTDNSKQHPGTETSGSGVAMPIRGSAPTLASTKTSPVLRDKFVPNANVAVDVDSEKFLALLIGRIVGKP